MNHLRYSGLTFAEQKAHMIKIVRGDPLLMKAFTFAQTMNLPDWYIVSGAIYNSIWNYLTGRPSGYGLKDIDLFYFEADDLSYEAEDKHIQLGTRVFAELSIPVEIRNQARVHLWFKDHFGFDYPELDCSRDGIDHFASKTHAVGMRLLEDDSFEIYAPFGLDDIFSFKITPNPVLDNSKTHATKGKRALEFWPQVQVEPWPTM